MRCRRLAAAFHNFIIFLMMSSARLYLAVRGNLKCNSLHLNNTCIRIPTPLGLLLHLEFDFLRPMCILLVTRFLIIAVSSVFASSALKRFSGKNKFSEKHRRHPSSEIEKPLTAGDDRNENTFLITPLDELTLTAAAAAGE